MSSRQDLALRAVLRVLRPLVRLLVGVGVTYPALAAALKPVFVDAAREELGRQRMKGTASALSLLSGVHRKDLRVMSEAPRARGDDGAARLHLVGQVVARWVTARGWQVAGAKAGGRPRVLPRSGGARSFDALVAGVSKDVRSKAVLDEMLRLGVVEETPDGVALVDPGLAPRHGFDAMCEALAVNLEDHAAAAAANVARGEGGDAAFLDQAVYVDEITEASVDVLRTEARAAWQAAFARIMAVAQERFDLDARDAPVHARARRFRFGVYGFDAGMGDAAGAAGRADVPDEPARAAPRQRSARTVTKQGRTR